MGSGEYLFCSPALAPLLHPERLTVTGPVTDQLLKGASAPGPALQAFDHYLSINHLRGHGQAPAGGTVNQVTDEPDTSPPWLT